MMTRAYYGMAGFVVLTACTGLLLNHRVMDIYNESIESNRRWAAWLTTCGQLSQLADEITTPADDLFSTSDGRATAARLVSAIGRFDEKVTEIRRRLEAEHRATGDPDMARLRGRFDRLVEVQDELNAAAGQIFAAFRFPERVNASEKATLMHRKLARLNRMLEELRVEIGSSQDRHFKEQQARAADQAKFEYLIASLILVMVGLVVDYGRRISRQMQRSADERERHVREMEARNEELRATQKELVATARKAGMAEIATGVLHNVGNALNSVNVSSIMIDERVRGSKLGALGKAVALLTEHSHELGPYLTDDPKGRQLPGYLVKLAAALEADRQVILGELRDLGQGVEHIKEIVKTQQSYAGSFTVIETTSVQEIVEDALRMSGASLIQHGVRVVRDFADVAPVPLDKHKALLILVNLISNAKQAMEAVEPADRVMTLRIERGEEAEVWVSVIDQGIGIPAENLTRIFSHGFTTKKGGHGFGLHSSVLAAREMGGTLVAHSDGAGCGARFTLAIPSSGKAAQAGGAVAGPDGIITAGPPAETAAQP
jgi:signal transduction histidine kinase